MGEERLLVAMRKEPRRELTEIRSGGTVSGAEPTRCVTCQQRYFAELAIAKRLAHAPKPSETSGCNAVQLGDSMCARGRNLRNVLHATDESDTIARGQDNHCSAFSPDAWLWVQGARAIISGILAFPTFSSGMPRDKLFGSR